MKKESTMMTIFGMNQMLDIVAYQNIILISKSIMFYAITNNEDVACWKRTLIIILAALPYVIILFTLFILFI